MANCELTEEMIYDNYEFKLLKKTLKKSYKWVKDMVLDGDPNKYDTIVFLELIINPFECAEIEGLNLSWYIRKDIPCDYTSLFVYFKEDLTNPKLLKINKDIETLPYKLNKSLHIPDEYRFNKICNKIFNVSKFSYIGENF